MGKAIFVSYKYADTSVAALEGCSNCTPRDYVSYLQDNKFSGDDVNKAEDDNEDLSEFKDDTIKSKLKDKIWSSSITLVLISPEMRDWGKDQSDQWIPWEIAYSLRTETRNNTSSLPNAIIAVVLPDRNNSYKYFIYNDELMDNNGKNHIVTAIKTYNTFTIIQKNMFNQKNPDTDVWQGQKVYHGDSSYIITVTWNDFINDTDKYIDQATDLKNKIENYELYKKL